MRIARQLTTLLLAIALINGCMHNSEKQTDNHAGIATLHDSTTRNHHDSTTRNQQGNYHARKFSVLPQEDFSILKVYSPWQDAAENSFTYLAGNDASQVPDSLSAIPFIRTPVERVVIMSTTFVPFIDTLGESHTISGVSGVKNLYDPRLRKKHEDGALKEVGSDQAMKYETIVALNPDVVFMFGVKAGIMQVAGKLSEAGIQVVICADYLEPHPLGRAEWLRFFSVFYGKEKLAEAIFNRIRSRYLSLAEKAVAPARKNREKPLVMMGLPWKDAWYVAGGKSFAAVLVEDAGGNYIFRDDDHAEAKMLSVEAVYTRALEADVWINPGIAADLQQVLDHDERFGELKAFRQQRVFNNNRRMGPGGGNDYWESGVLHPDRILEDLVRIFHDSIPDEQGLHYYTRLK